MATRWYVGNSAAPYTPATIRGGWEKTAGAVTGLLAGRPTGTAATIAQSVGATTNPYDVLWGRWVSAPAVAADTISGTLSYILGRVENNAGANANFYLHVFVTAGDSDTVRGTLLANYTLASEFPTTAAGGGASGVAVTSTAIQAGDRLVVEVGYRALGATSAAYTATLNYGNTGVTDLASGGTGVTTAPGWIELSGADGLFAPQVSTLIDNFNDNTLNEDLWDYSYGTHSEVGGRARVGCEVTYAGYGSLPIWHLADSSIYAQVPTLPAAGGGAEVYANFTVLSGIEGTYAGIYFNRITNKLRFNSNVDYWDGSAVEIDYSATDHQWVRIRQAGASLYWDTSPDGSTWTTRRTLATAPSWTRYQGLQVALEAHRDAGTPDFAEFDNVNTLTPTVTYVAVGVATEASAGRPVARAKRRTVATAAAGSAARPVTGSKARRLGAAAEAAGARPVTATKRLGLGPAAAVTGARAVAAVRTLPVGTARTATGTSRLAVTRQARLGTTRTTDGGRGLVVVSTGHLGAAHVATQTFPVVVGRTLRLGVALVVEGARLMVAGRRTTLTAGREQSVARPVAARHRVRLGVARTVTDAQALMVSGAVVLGAARTSVSGAPAVGAKRYSLAAALAVASGRPVSHDRTAHVTGAAATERAHLITAVRTVPVRSGRELTTAPALGTSRAGLIAAARDVEQGLAVEVSGASGIGPARMGARACPVTASKRRQLEAARTYDEGLPLTAGRLVAVGAARTGAGARPVPGRKAYGLGSAAVIEAGRTTAAFGTATIGTARSAAGARPLTAVRTVPVGAARQAAGASTVRVGRTVHVGAGRTVAAVGPVSHARTALLGAARSVEIAWGLSGRTRAQLGTARQATAAAALGAAHTARLGRAATAASARPVQAGQRIRLGTARCTARARSVRQPFQTRFLRTAHQPAGARPVGASRQRPADHLTATSSGPLLTTSAAGPRLIATTTRGG
ncbi:hypothetical protein ACIOG7_10360 [Streptomyces sp. NPDC087894]|uniref:hypothetical protein n=1 Tax=Streptomyces sp. NPDC087894 TaxID=3365816 RepID=UPI003810B213